MCCIQVILCVLYTGDILCVDIHSIEHFIILKNY